MSAGPRTAYSRGRRFELEVRKALEAAGYSVTRSFMSRGVYDLVAVGRLWLGEVLFVQCKKWGSCGPDEWNRLWELAQRHEALPIIAIRKPRGPMMFFRLTAAKTVPGRQPREPWTLKQIFPGNTEGDDGTKG